MANAIEHLDNLHNNAYILSPLLESFFENTEQREKDILLSYLVLPLLLHKESSVKIKNSNIKSSIYTIFSSPSIIYGLNDRVYTFKGVTNKCLLLSSMEKSLSINSDMSVNFINKNMDNAFCNRDHLRAAAQLAKLFNSHDIVEIFRKLGVTNL
ncbi:three component ABC system middle component [Enterovibrio norvegicus]|uniref:three component ABC system middle component n=1 Tax=Enterovibrio norvegicus TaxID=188144 RepID=UPI00352CBAC8